MNSSIYYSVYQTLTKITTQKKKDKPFDLSSLVAEGGLEQQYDYVGDMV